MDGMFEAASQFGLGDEWYTQMDAYLDGWTRDESVPGYAMSRNQTEPFGASAVALFVLVSDQPCQTACFPSIAAHTSTPVVSDVHHQVVAFEVLLSVIGCRSCHVT